MRESGNKTVDRPAERAINLLGACAVVVTDAWSAVYEAQLGRGGSSSATALVSLLTFGTLTIEQLAKSLDLSHSGASRCVDRLEERAWVSRQGGEPAGLADGRTVSVSLTEAGIRAAQEVLSSRRAALERIMSPLTSTQQAALGDLLAGILAAQTPDRAALRRVCRTCDHVICDPCPALTNVEHTEVSKCPLGQPPSS